MDSAHEKLLENFEEFEADLEVEEILKKVKQELAVFGNDEDIREFGEQLLEERRKRSLAAKAAQAARAAYVSPVGTRAATHNLPASGTSRGSIICCSYWRYQFKRPQTPPPAPPPSPDVQRKRGRSAAEPTTTHESDYRPNNDDLNDYDPDGP